MVSSSHRFSPCGEFWQLLGQALLPPRGEAFIAAMREDLPADLHGLAREIGLDLDAGIARLLQEMEAFADAESLLVTYSSLFLAPPRLARLNIGYYLDGTLFGNSTRILMELYGRQGVAPSPGLHDTPDHLVTVLELLALLFHRAEEAGEESRREELLADAEMVRRLLLRALPKLSGQVRDAEKERALPAFYSVLIELLQATLRDDNLRFFASPADEKSLPKYFSKRKTAPDLVPCKTCGKPVATARELRDIIGRLHRAGLTADYLELCPDCRDGNRGWKRGQTGFNTLGVR